MFGLFRAESDRADKAYSEGLSALRAVIAGLTQRNEALAEENGKLKSTVEMQFADLRRLMAAPPPPAPAPQAQGAPTTAGLELTERLRKEAEARNEGRIPPSGAFRNMAVSGGHVKPTTLRVVKS